MKEDKLIAFVLWKQPTPANKHLLDCDHLIFDPLVPFYRSNSILFNCMSSSKTGLTMNHPCIDVRIGATDIIRDCVANTICILFCQCGWINEWSSYYWDLVVNVLLCSELIRGRFRRFEKCAVNFYRCARWIITCVHFFTLKTLLRFVFVLVTISKISNTKKIWLFINILLWQCRV